MSQFPFYKQPDNKDCGPSCLKIIAKFYHKRISIEQLRRFTETTRDGSTLLAMSDAAESIGFRSLGVSINIQKLKETPLPCILHWNKNHYVVLYKIKSPSSYFPTFRRSSMKEGRNSKKSSIYYISDPAHGLLKYNKSAFAGICNHHFLFKVESWG